MNPYLLDLLLVYKKESSIQERIELGPIHISKKNTYGTNLYQKLVLYIVVLYSCHSYFLPYIYALSFFLFMGVGAHAPTTHQ